MDLGRLLEAVEGSGAFRRVLRLQPAGGQGGFVAPPTYAGDDGPVHIFEVRSIGDRDVQCVLLDSFQSQANRLEAALSEAIEAGDLRIPYAYVDFAGTPIADVGRVSTLDASHRMFDAIVRDSQIGGTPFPDTPMGRAVYAATPRNATALYRYSPTTLVFGGWNSTGARGGGGPRFGRCVTSEIVGVGVPVTSDGAGGTVSCMVPSSRIDELGITAVDIYAPGGANQEWSTEGAEGARAIKPSKVNHSNVAPTVSARGVTMRYALQTTVVSLAGIKRLSFPDDGGRIGRERDSAARAVIAALSLYAVARGDTESHMLRSGCDLYPEEEDAGGFELVHAGGRVTEEVVTPGMASRLLEEAVRNAEDRGISWEAEPVALAPQKRLVDLVLKSREARPKGG